MNKSMVMGLVIGITIAVAASGIAGYNLIKKDEFAEVIAIKEIVETVKTPREECGQVAVQKQAPVKDKNKLTGTIAGAVVGGLLGNQVGGGTGKKLATVAGAAAGGYAGNKIQGNMQKSDVVTTSETRCETVYDMVPTKMGYDVTYMLDGKQGIVRMLYNPGARIPVKDGQLVIASPTATPVPATPVQPQGSVPATK